MLAEMLRVRGQISLIEDRLRKGTWIGCYRLAKLLFGKCRGLALCQMRYKGPKLGIFAQSVDAHRNEGWRLCSPLDPE